MSATPTFVIGADPGKAGAVVILRADTFDPGTPCDLRYIRASVDGKYLDTDTMLEELLEATKDGKIALTVKELVHPLYGSSAEGHWNFGDADGCLRTLLKTCFLRNRPEAERRFEQIAPKAWQAIAWACVDVIKDPVLDSKGHPVLLKGGQPKWKVDTKGTSARAVHTIFPDINFVPPRCRKEDDGIIDAALIAYVAWCRAKKLKLF